MLLINYYFYEKTYRVSYISLSFLGFFQLFFTYKRELLYLITTKLNYPYFIVYNISDLFFINISLAFFFTILTCLPYIYFQYLLYHKTTYTATIQHNIFKRFLLGTCYYILMSYVTLYYLTPKIWNWFLFFEIYNSSILVEITPQITNYLTFLTKTYILLFISHILIYFILYYFPKKAFSKKYIHLFYSRIFIYPMITLCYSILTPPDIFTLILLLIPFSIIYELFLITLLYNTKHK